jgi:hypothetical protein
MFEGVSEYLHHQIMTRVKANPPLVFAYACGLSPPDATMAKAALHRFRDRMPGWMDRYFDDVRRDASGTRFHVPAVENFSETYIKELGIEVFCAFKRASRDNVLPDEEVASWDWEILARDFLNEMGWVEEDD